jgi:hypothetical protein
MASSLICTDEQGLRVGGLAAAARGSAAGGLVLVAQGSTREGAGAGGPGAPRRGGLAAVAQGLHAGRAGCCDRQ